MGAKPRKSKKQSTTNAHYQRQLKRTVFFLERSLGGQLLLDEIRKAGVRAEPHKKWFRHDTFDEIWLPQVGEKKWIVLMRDQKIGKRLLELDALLYGGVKAFALVTGEMKDLENAQVIIKALPKILAMVAENRFPFIAKVYRDSSVEMWKTKAMIHKGVQRKRS